MDQSRKFINQPVQSYATCQQCRQLVSHPQWQECSFRLKTRCPLPEAVPAPEKSRPDPPQARKLPPMKTPGWFFQPRPMPMEQPVAVARNAVGYAPTIQVIQRDLLAPDAKARSTCQYKYQRPVLSRGTQSQCNPAMPMANIRISKRRMLTRAAK